MKKWILSAYLKEEINNIITSSKMFTSPKKLEKIP
jgi:hypothetical protein